MTKDVFARIEMKFVLNGMQYHAFRNVLDDIAHVDEYGETTICNIYYDTPSYRLIRTSLEKPSYKEKLRLRTYGIPDADSPCFLEVKKKFQRVVYKRRVRMSYEKALGYLERKCAVRSPEEVAEDHEHDAERLGITSGLEQQILKEIDYFTAHYAPLMPAMVITYDRIAMTGNEDPELRITFDRNIRWRKTALDLTKGTHGRDVLPKRSYLMELKIAGGIPMEIVRVLSRLKIRPTSFSKYGKAYEQMMRSGQADKEQEKIVTIRKRQALPEKKTALA